jgi:hypothetical protein
MISKRKVAANRRNAAHSTGPNTAKGKARASRNAYKHGLAVSVLNDRAISAEVERLARSIVGETGTPYELMQARVVAETEFDLLRVWATRLKITEASIGAVVPELASGAQRAGALPDSPMQSQFLEAQRAYAVLRALPRLEMLERYERRAFSRRQRDYQANLQVGYLTPFSLVRFLRKRSSVTANMRWQSLRSGWSAAGRQSQHSCASTDSHAKYIFEQGTIAGPMMRNMKSASKASKHQTRTLSMRQQRVKCAIRIG